MKRFWSDAAPLAAGDGWSIGLDGRPVRLPSGAVLCVPGEALATAIAAEWREAGGERGQEMGWDDVPLTRLAGTAQDRILPAPAPVAEGIARYGESDLLCYRAAHPRPLVLRQARSWQPILDWAARAHGAELIATEGVTHVQQPEAALAALRRVVDDHDGWELAALGLAVPALGSVVLGLALSSGRLTAGQAHELSVLDELWQEEQWGADAEAIARRKVSACEVELAGRFLALHRSRG